MTAPDRYPIPHIQVFPAATAQKSLILQARPCSRLPSNSNDPRRHRKDGRHHTIRLVRILTYAFRLTQRGPIFSAIHGPSHSWIRFRLTYIDDVFIASFNPEEHKQHLRQVFEQIDFLGRHINGRGITPLPEKKQSIIDYPTPQSVKSLRRFLGVVNYYGIFIPSCAQVLQPLTHLLKGNPKYFKMTPGAESTFSSAKQKLSKATKLYRLDTSNGTRIVLKTDAFQGAVGTVLQQVIKGEIQPLSFSKKLTPSEPRNSTFGRELLAIYLAIKHFRHMLEGRHLTIFTDHKPLIYAIEIRHLGFFVQFTNDIRHIGGASNVVADAMSRMELNKIVIPSLVLQVQASEQKSDPDNTEITSNPSLHFECLSLPDSNTEILCGRPRPFVPQAYRRKIFDHFHGLSHPSILAKTKLITDRFVWKNIRQDVRYKIHKHILSPLSCFLLPKARFRHIHIDIVGPLPPSNSFTYILTCIDRFTRWPIAVPLRDTSVESVAKALRESWISIFGVLFVIMTDRGSQFTSTPFRELNQLLGSTHIRTTECHPEANGLV
nr:gag pol polyprotein [Hymenolepis microstoma]